MNKENKKFLGLGLTLQILPLFVIFIIALSKVDWSWIALDWNLFLIITGIGMYEILVGLFIWSGLKSKKEE